MTFDWNKVLPGPAPDELEISCFGPGFGECIVVHVGEGKWVVVDSCVESGERDKRPVAERYLRALNVRLESDVILIVATHWHSDHICGLGRLVDLCSGAEFSCANALLQNEFMEYRGGPGQLDRDRVLLSEIFCLIILMREGAEDDEEKAAEPYVGVQGEGGGGGPEGRAHFG